MIRLPNLQRVSRPATLKEAGDILTDPARKAAVMAGGITYFFGTNSKIEELVNISDLNLDFIKTKSGGLVLGATTRISDLIKNRVVKNYAGGIISRVASRIGSSLNRNLVTVGGNIMQPFIWCDLPTLFMALGATIVTGGTRERRIPADEFFQRHPRQQLSAGEIVIKVELPQLPRGFRDAYKDLALTQNDFALIKVAGLAKVQTGRCHSLSLVVGGATVLPQRALSAEKLLVGKKISAAGIKKAADATAQQIKLVRDIRCTSKYKRSLTKVLVSDILEQLLLGKVKR